MRFPRPVGDEWGCSVFLKGLLCAAVSKQQYLFCPALARLLGQDFRNRVALELRVSINGLLRVPIATTDFPDTFAFIALQEIRVDDSFSLNHLAHS